MSEADSRRAEPICWNPRRQTALAPVFAFLFPDLIHYFLGDQSQHDQLGHVRTRIESVKAAGCLATRSAPFVVRLLAPAERTFEVLELFLLSRHKIHAEHIEADRRGSV